MTGAGVAGEASRWRSPLTGRVLVHDTPHSLAALGELQDLQGELVAMQQWVVASGAKIMVVFEGRDTAGKGGAIGAISENLNPRQCHIAALSKPSEREAGQCMPGLGSRDDRYAHTRTPS